MDVEEEEETELENFAEEMYVYLCNLVTYDIIRKGQFKGRFDLRLESMRTVQFSIQTYLRHSQSQKSDLSVSVQRENAKRRGFHTESLEKVQICIFVARWVRKAVCLESAHQRVHQTKRVQQRVDRKDGSFPEISNNQLVRHLYYHGKIKTIQLKYAEAYKMLSQALRKVPQNTALGFRVDVKLTILVRRLSKTHDTKLILQSNTHNRYNFSSVNFPNEACSIRSSTEVNSMPILRSHKLYEWVILTRFNEPCKSTTRISRRTTRNRWCTDFVTTYSRQDWDVLVFRTVESVFKTSRPS